MDAARPQHQQEEEQERKASMEKTAKVFSSKEEEADSSDADEPIQNHRGWKAMPYVIGDCSSSSTSCLISLLLLCNYHAHTVLFPEMRKTRLLLF